MHNSSHILKDHRKWLESHLRKVSSNIVIIAMIEQRTGIRVTSQTISHYKRKLGIKPVPPTGGCPHGEDCPLCQQHIA